MIELATRDRKDIRLRSGNLVTGSTLKAGGTPAPTIWLETSSWAVLSSALRRALKDPPTALPAVYYCRQAL